MPNMYFEQDAHPINFGVTTTSAYVPHGIVTETMIAVIPAMKEDAQVTCRNHK